jgi:hypothetical protein
MSVSLEKLGLSRPSIIVTHVDRATVRSIVNAERALCARAIQLGIDVDEAHSGYAPYIEGLMKSMSEADRDEFQRILVEETLNDEKLDEAVARANEAEHRYAKAVEQLKSPGTGRIFMAGVNLTILIGLALFWAFR